MKPKPVDLQYLVGAVSCLGLAAALSVAAVPATGAERDPVATDLPTRTASAPHSPAVHLQRPSRAVDPEPVPGSMLRAARGRIREGRADPATEVDRWSVAFATDHGSPAALHRFGRYRPLIEAELASRHMPQDLAFVAWVESEWQVTATSPAGAAGIWQFMPSTARAYGLEVSSFVDERRDPIRSTGAAIRYLADLYAEAQDWPGALAGYNAGSGRAAAARHDFWGRRWTLPAETRAYVPRVLAAARVGRDPRAWGLSPAPDAPLRFREVWVTGRTSLDSLADRLGLPRAEVEALNPHLIRGCTPPGRRWPVRVPAEPTLPVQSGGGR